MKLTFGLFQQHYPHLEDQYFNTILIKLHIIKVKFSMHNK